MQKIVINGGQPLRGVIPVSGSKNAALPIMAASILTNEKLELSNVPDLVDVKTMSLVLSSLGVNVTKLEKGKFTFNYFLTDSQSRIK